jgi:hypothetical protein
MSWLIPLFHIFGILAIVAVAVSAEMNEPL